MSLALGLFYLAAILAIASAIAMITARNVVHAVLFMVFNFGLTGVIYLLLHAPFIAVVQVVVYAGAIMVLFLFVVMLLDQHDLALDEPLLGQRPIGLLAVVLLGLFLGYGLLAAGEPSAAAQRGAANAAAGALPVPADFGSPTHIGAELFGHQVLPFELVSFLLLAAMLGAVVISRFGRADRAGADETVGGDGP